jgi:transposase
LGKISEKASKGLILTISDIRKDVEEKTGHKVSDDYLWDLFHRHGWKKKAPRPVHPINRKKEQEEFKKNLKRRWQFAS